MNGHITRAEDFDLYALGALDADEKAAIESHLLSCDECKRKLAEAQGRIAALGLSAPLVPPPPQAREQLLRRIQTGAQSAAPSRAEIIPARGERDTRLGGSPSARRWDWFFAPAFAALLVTTGLLWVQNVRLDKQLEGLRATLQKQQRQIEENGHLAHLLGAKDTVTVSLEPMPGMPKGAVSVMYNAKMGELMYDGWIDPPPSDKSYQLWVVPMEGAPISAGVFNPATSDEAHWMTKVPAGVAAKAFAVTLEPAGGMPQPTGPKVFVGPVS